MKKHSSHHGAGIAAVALTAMPALDVLVDPARAGAAHVLLALVGLWLCAVYMTGDARKEGEA